MSTKSEMQSEIERLRTESRKSWEEKNLVDLQFDRFVGKICGPFNVETRDRHRRMEVFQEIASMVSSRFKTKEDIDRMFLIIENLSKALAKDA